MAYEHWGIEPGSRARPGPLWCAVTAGDALARPERNVISLLEGMDIHQGPPGSLRLDNELLSGACPVPWAGSATGKTNAMKHLIRQLRMNAAADAASS